MINITNLKTSLRIDHEEDDALLEMLLETAKSYVASSIDSTVDVSYFDVYKQFDWCVSLLSQHWYNNRDESINQHIPATSRALIQQMRGKHYANH